jgi:c-di-GMP-binding flagellar brake protein YcgR
MKKPLPMASAGEVERRICHRVLLNIDIEVCPLPRNDSNTDFSVLSCKARDISGGGVSFYGDVLYLEHSVLRLRIPLTINSSGSRQQESQVLKVMGKVMWSRKDSSAENYATGVRFLNIYEGDYALLESYVKIRRALCLRGSAE